MSAAASLTSSRTPREDQETPRRERALGRRYLGERNLAGCRVAVVDGQEERPLAPRKRHLLWSFGGGMSGASTRELAWAILYDSAQDVRLADDWCSAFAAEVLARLPSEEFCVYSRDVLAWLYEERRP